MKGINLTVQVQDFYNENPNIAEQKLKDLSSEEISTFMLWKTKPQSLDSMQSLSQFRRIFEIEKLILNPKDLG